MSLNLPILVGSGQSTTRSKTVEDFVHPIEAMKRVIQAAAEDAGCPALIDRADSIHIVNMLAWNSRNAPAAVSEALGITPAVQEYTAIGGNSPQWLVGRAADRLATGASRVTILAGCEVVRSVKLAMKFGKDIGSHREKVEVPLVGTNRPGTTDIENAHAADRPVRIYPMIENALRAKEGMTIEGQREWLGKFAESFSAVAAANPLSWFPVKRGAEEAVTATAQNRMIGWPYPKYLNAVMEVDQAAAVIMTTTDEARALGIPEEKWVYLHGSQDAADLWHVSERADFADSPAMLEAANDALAQAGMGVDAMNFFDLYSCFPCVPRLSCRLLGIDFDDARPKTVTGGLPYFGGAGNNYVMHSIAEAMNRIRKNRDEFGMVTANGYYCTKHSIGVYGGRPPERIWKRTSPEAFQSALALPKALETDPEPTGEFVVDAYTVWHDQNGEPEYGILAGRTAEGLRAWAQTAREAKDLMGAMMREEFTGRRGKIAGRNGKINIVEF